jgi:rod shape-determining protein MreD
MRGRKKGMAVGIISGLFADLFWGNLLGFNILLYTVIGYASGSFRRLFFDDDIKLPIALVAASDLFYGLMNYFCLYMLQGDFAFRTYLTKIIFPELVYTILVTLVLYQILLQIHKKLEAEEQRSASKFV